MNEDDSKKVHKLAEKILEEELKGKEYINRGIEYLFKPDDLKKFRDNLNEIQLYVDGKIKKICAGNLDFLIYIS